MDVSRGSSKLLWALGLDRRSFSMGCLSVCLSVRVYIDVLITMPNLVAIAQTVFLMMFHVISIFYVSLVNPNLYKIP